MEREQAFDFLKQNLTNQNLIKHSLAVEAIMRALAEHFGQDKEKWGMVGLLHDIDYERVKSDLAQHSLVGAKMLEDAGFEKDICQAVKVHNEGHGIAPETLMEKAGYVVDPISGLIVAAALVLPSKKLADLTTKNVLNRFDEKSFARGANRQIIKKCEELLVLSLNDFARISLEAMQGIAGDLGL
ncbi:MAG: phosphohydrolase [Candidatus Portnoybacteria bacterium RBG_19FT_COMBO_36_7]|uniref:Phosphohydrolase n=1 Tax=Candidatus Portnoybacteria bacterium RBG_19FT_COMBO_36_7 TaxID=1801992 RepID=A0A1G2F6P7_9BACT|nr:MAG: phosphohydrolase [Candidatus Portnoybacteria bacterium RBG_19FT_COMBO_36_7]